MVNVGQFLNIFTIVNLKLIDLSAIAAFLLLTFSVSAQQVTVKHPVRFDESKPLNDSLFRGETSKQQPYQYLYPDQKPSHKPGKGNSSALQVEQTHMGAGPAPQLIASFGGLGAGFPGTDSTVRFRNPSDNTLAVGYDHIFQIVNSRMAIYTKAGKQFDETGKVLFGPVETRMVFQGFGGVCEKTNNGDAVVRYDQLADRWLIVMPIFRKSKEGTYSMCYAVSMTPNPFGPYYRYEFIRELFPDYPRPAVWPDGYYITTSTGDNVIQKHAVVVDRNRMLKGEEATEQMFLLDGVNFLINADLEGPRLPPAGAPNIMMAAGGSQLHGILKDDGIFIWKFHTNWEDPQKSRLEGPVRIPVAPYEYLGGGQLTEAVPQPGSSQRLDAQGDKLMARMVYRRIGNRESLVVVHSVANSAGGGGVRWYEFRLTRKGDPVLFQQGTYAPEGNFRWMGSPAIDAAGNIGIGYSFGGSGDFAGQRFAGRLASDPAGIFSLQESILVKGEAAQERNRRWEDYTQTAVDPIDDRTLWYVGDYLKKGEKNYSTMIGAFRLGTVK